MTFENIPGHPEDDDILRKSIRKTSQDDDILEKSIIVEYLEDAVAKGHLQSIFVADILMMSNTGMFGKYFTTNSEWRFGIVPNPIPQG